MTSKRKIKTKRRFKRCKAKQKHGLLNRYDFAYAGRDVVIQTFKNLDKSSPQLINNLSKELNKITEERVKQLLPQGRGNLRKS